MGGSYAGIPGRYVPLAETILGFEEICDGKHDEVPEQAFYMVGTIDAAPGKAGAISPNGRNGMKAASEAAKEMAATVGGGTGR